MQDRYLKITEDSEAYQIGELQEWIKNEAKKISSSYIPNS